MNIAIVSFGLMDVVIPLAKYLSDRCSVDLYMVFAQSYKRDGILNLDDINTASGFISKERTAALLEPELNHYIGNKVGCYLYLYPGWKINRPSTFLASFKLAQILRRMHYDCIHFNGNNLQQSVISFLTKDIPKIHTIHDYIGHSGERKRLAELFNKYIVYTKNQKIFHSRWCAKLAGKKLPGTKAGTINIIPYYPLNIYKMWENPALFEEGNTILFFGRISSYKGIKYLLKAVPIIKKEVHNLKVILAGEGKYPFDIGDLQNNNTYKIINRYIPNRELVELIQKSSILICPYTDATQSAVIMTAYAFNKPVVATNVGGIPEAIEDGITGVLVPSRDPQRLAEAIIGLLKDPGKRTMMAENIKRKFSQDEFSWDSAAQKTIEVYKKAIEK